MTEKVMELAEELLHLLPDTGTYRERALGTLQACARWAYLGIDEEQDLSTVWVPVVEPTPGHPPVDDTPAAELGLEMWQFGVLHSDLHPFQRLVAAVLAARADADSHITEYQQPTLHDLQRETGLVMPDLHTALQELDRRGWIVRHPNLQGSTRRIRYELTLPACAPAC